MPKTSPAQGDLAQRLRSSFWDFVQHFWPVVVPEAPRYNWHMEYLAGVLQAVADRAIGRQAKRYDLVLNLPPGTTKSTLCSQMYPAWVWANDPTHRFICGSYSQAIALDQAERCRQLVKSEAYQDLFPQVRLDRKRDAKQHFVLTAGGERYSTSVGSAVTGIHAHQIIVDDPSNPRLAQSQTTRKAANDWLSKTLTSRKVDQRSSPLLLVMQRLHVEDSTAHMVARGSGVRHISLPAELHPSLKPKALRPRYVDGLLDPERLPHKVLADMKRQLGSAEYQAQMLQDPAPQEGGILKPEWFTAVPPKSVQVPVVDFFLDTAYTSSQANDPTAVVVAGRVGQDLVVTYAASRWMEFPELIRFVGQLVADHGGTAQSRVFVEPKASGLSIVQQLRRQTGLNVVKAQVPREEKLTRVHHISPLVEAGRIKLVHGPWNEAFIGQCAAFPHAKHDDELDALVMAVNTLLMAESRQVFL